jgi:phosphoribosylamine--glycine ligase/phosphoribosylformylglycinamidine cyclo-ligase
MNVFLIGSGGREHALAWKIAQSPRLAKLVIAPGNPGTAQLGENVSLPINGEDGFSQALALCQERKIDLVVVGPEVPLAAGIADVLISAGFPVFGPNQAGAQLESSKAFAKTFMAQNGIPTAPFAIFDNFEAALAYVQQAPYPVVIKASGLAAGKGVLLPESQAEARSALQAMLLDRQFGAAGQQVIIEERLSGEEISLLAFCDGKSVQTMPPAQDHKRLLDGDQGPNTGGMGAYTPAPVASQSMIQEALSRVFQPTLAGLQAQGIHYVGVLYAGLILTNHGLSVLEFNCRFGDPETQAILPLLDSDLLEIMAACTQGRLAGTSIQWKNGAAACVVAAAQGYPGSYTRGIPIYGLDSPLENAVVFHAGTRQLGEQILSDGGRVLGISGWGDGIGAALNHAYAALQTISFDRMHYRQDIGWRALNRQARTSQHAGAYANAGVDIDAGNQAVELMDQALRSTYGPEVLAGVGAFGGLFDAAGLKKLRNPVLVASTDGVGTKVKLAAQAGSYASIGMDIVNHCCNDILVQGARPLFFLDYFASSKLNPEIVAQVVAGMAEACRASGCALLGGETAEMPGVYAPDQFDIVGTIVGVVEKSQILPRQDIQAGDMLVGLRSSGAHTNGYSLIRQVFSNTPLETIFPELDEALGTALLAPHRSYLPVLDPILINQPGWIKALAHITGGGLVENLPRVLPSGMGAEISVGSWSIPPLFKLIQQHGQIQEQEMYRVFNMGIGMVCICAPQDLASLQAAFGEESFVIGAIVNDPDHRVTLK